MIGSISRGNTYFFFLLKKKKQKAPIIASFLGYAQTRRGGSIYKMMSERYRIVNVDKKQLAKEVCELVDDFEFQRDLNTKMRKIFS